MDSGSGTVYYVSLAGDDRNAGDAARPWRHIEWAMTRPFLRAGDTVRVRGGVYRPVIEPVPARDSTTDDTLIRPVASGAPGRPITVTAEPGETVLLSGRLLAADWTPAGDAVYFHDYVTPATYPYDHPFQVVEDGRLLYRVSSLEGVDRPGRCYVDTAARRIYVWTSDGRPPSGRLMEYGVSISGIEFRNGVSHWRLEGLAISGFRTTGVVLAGGGGAVELDRMDISYIGAHRPGADFTNGFALAVQDTAGGNLIRRSRFHHTLAEAVHVSQTGAGGDLYEDNEMYDTGGATWLHEGHTGRILTGPGMILRGNRVTVRGNRFLRAGYHGLILESDLRGSEGRSNPSQNVVEGNTFSMCAGNGIHGDGKNGEAVSAANIIRFNLFDRNNQARRGSDGDAELRIAGNLDDTLVYNNTFHSEHANGVLLFTARVANGTAQGADAAPERTRLFNNIVVHTSATRQTYALRGVEASPDAEADVNNWYRVGTGPLVQWNGATFGTLDEFRRQTGQERRGMSMDPRFVSLENGHYWLRAISPMIGRGVAEPPGAARDLGAFPYRALLGVAPAQVSFVAVAGGRNPPAQTVTVHSAAGTPLAFTARASGEKWVRLAVSGADAPAAVTVTVEASGLTAGIYTATIEVAPGVAGEPAMAVSVRLEIVPAPPRRRSGW